jgi:eukaryotic-like serine/threonine-protein kinase
VTGPGRRQLAGYHVDALIGRGGMAEVWRATAQSGPRAGRAVALKRLLPALARDPTYVELFRREALVMRRLRHPACIEVFESGVADGTDYIAMEYVDGRNLRQVLAQCAARSILLPVDFGCYVAHVLAEALDHAHAGLDRDGRPLGIVHCDVSPSNVFISKMGEIKLGDFGVALTPGATKALLGPGALGKVRYLAPEQILPQPITPRTDLFALGAVLFELLTNRPAFEGNDPDAVGQAILAGRLRAPSELRPELPFEIDALVLRCLVADPAERWPSAAALAEEISTRYDPGIGTPLAIAAVVRGLFGVK